MSGGNGGIDFGRTSQPGNRIGVVVATGGHLELLKVLEVEKVALHGLWRKRERDGRHCYPSPGFFKTGGWGVQRNSNSIADWGVH